MREYVNFSDPEEVKEILIPLSPIYSVEQSLKCPVLILHGKNDPRVPVSQAQDLFNKIRKIRKVAKHTELVIMGGEGHVISKTSNRVVLYQKIYDWLTKRTKSDF